DAADTACGPRTGHTGYTGYAVPAGLRSAAGVFRMPDTPAAARALPTPAVRPAPVPGSQHAPHVPDVLPSPRRPDTQTLRPGDPQRSTGLKTPETPENPERRQLAHELAGIERLEVGEFFLCVHDIVAAARRMGIRISGRGSAANSLVAYLLGITGVDPLRHGLLFERFLNPDRAGMPDIDLDVQSDRRDELIRYVERTYTEAHAAMVANVSTYRAQGALRDAAKALGYPLGLVGALTKVLPHHCGREELAGYMNELAGGLQRGLTGGESATSHAREPT